MLDANILNFIDFSDDHDKRKFEDQKQQIEDNSWSYLSLRLLTQK